MFFDRTGLDHLRCSNPIGCHLQAINNVSNLIFNRKAIKEFDALQKPFHGLGEDFKGEWFTGSILSIGDNLPHFKAAKHFLEERGFQVLGTQHGAHGDYKMYLFGKGFTLPGE